MRRRKLFYVREFLNLPGENTTACILAKVDPGDSWPLLEISDCSRKISLDFSLSHLEPQQVENVKHKLALLRKTIVGFEKAVLAAVADAEEKERARARR